MHGGSRARPAAAPAGTGQAGEIDGRGQAARFQAGTVGRKAGKLPGRGQGGQARPAGLGT